MMKEKVWGNNKESLVASFCTNGPDNWIEL